MNNFKNNSSELDPNTDYSYFQKLLGNYLKAERLKAGFKSAGSFAVFIDMAESQYREYERGETDIKLSNLLKVFRGLNKQIEDVFSIDILGVKSEELRYSSNRLSLMESQVRTQVSRLNGAEFERNLTIGEIERIFKILFFCLVPNKKREIIGHLKLADKTANFLMIFQLLLNNNWLVMQFPESPNTPNQRYYTTKAGKEVITSK